MRAWGHMWHTSTKRPFWLMKPTTKFWSSRSPMSCNPENSSSLSTRMTRRQWPICYTRPRSTWMLKTPMIARGGRPKKGERQDDPRPNKGRKSARIKDWRDDMRSRPPLGRTANFTPLNTPLDQVFMQIREDIVLTWLDKLKGDPNKRPRNKYCRFHWDHEHDTSKCYDLK